MLSPFASCCAILYAKKILYEMLTVCFADGHEAKFGFVGQKDLFQVANAISARIL